MYKYVIFDFDGTLANTIEDLADAVNNALVTHGFSAYPTEDYYYFVGSGVINLIRRTLGDKKDDDELVMQIKSEFDKYYSVHCTDKTYPYAGIKEMLKAFEQENIKIAVLSNKPDDYMQKLINKYFDDVNFAAVWGKKPQYDIKPSPDSLFGIMKTIGANKEETLYVGDSNTDIFTAKNAGVDSAGAIWGFRTKDELVNAGATNTFENAKQLCEFVLNENKAQ